MTIAAATRCVIISDAFVAVAVANGPVPVSHRGYERDRRQSTRPPTFLSGRPRRSTTLRRVVST
jgi:hypothetical protein